MVQWHKQIAAVRLALAFARNELAHINKGSQDHQGNFSVIGLLPHNNSNQP